jgi:hypothetical protein
MASRIHGLLTADTVATVTVEAPSNTIALSTIYGPDTKEISDGIKAIHVMVAFVGSPNANIAYVTVDGTTPTVKGNNTYAVATGDSGRLIRIPTSVSNVTVKIISAATLTYAIEAVD